MAAWRPVTTAHLLFLIVGLGPLASGIASLVPMSTGTAGGVGLLVLVPLTLAGFVAAVAGVMRTIHLRGPRSLVILSILSVLYVAAFFTMDTDFMPDWLGQYMPPGLGLAIVATALYGLARTAGDGGETTRAAEDSSAAE